MEIEKEDRAAVGYQMRRLGKREGERETGLARGPMRVQLLQRLSKERLQTRLGRREGVFNKGGEKIAAAGGGGCACRKTSQARRHSLSASLRTAKSGLSLPGSAPEPSLSRIFWMLRGEGSARSSTCRVLVVSRVVSQVCVSLHSPRPSPQCTTSTEEPSFSKLLLITITLAV